MNFSDAQVELCASVRRAPRQLSLRALMDTFAPAEAEDESVLRRLERLQRTMELLNFAVSPEIDGNLDALRLVSVAVPAPSIERISEEIRRGEDHTTEFKSTYCCCLRTLRAKSGLQPHQYRKPEVEFACLSAIAGMMNSSGGVVLVGVEDNKEIAGLEPDFHAMQVSNSDRWQLFVRDRIVQTFVDGRAVSAHVQISFGEVERRTVARIAVQPRQKLTFLSDLEKPTCPPKLLRRLDNQTVEIKAAELEEFFDQRSRSRIER